MPGTQQTGQGRAAGFPEMWPQVLATVEAKLAAPDYKIEIMVIAAR